LKVIIIAFEAIRLIIRYVITTCHSGINKLASSCSINEIRIIAVKALGASIKDVIITIFAIIIGTINITIHVIRSHVIIYITLRA